MDCIIVYIRRPKRLTKDQEEDKDSQIIDEGWNSKKQMSELEKKKGRKKLLYPDPKFSLSYDDPLSGEMAQDMQGNTVH